VDLAFDGRHVVVTGGAGALGSGVVSLLVQRGATVDVPDLRQIDPERFTLARHERVHVASGVDLTSQSDVESFYAGLDADGPLWASIHVAGGFAMGPIESSGAEDFSAMMRLNALSCYL